MTPKELGERTAFAFQMADATRLASLQRARRLQEARIASLEAERARLATRYGGEDPRVAAVEERLSTLAVFTAELTAEGQRAATPPPLIEEGQALIHGRVVNDLRQGLSGLHVTASVDGGSTVARDCTDANGYFRLLLGKGAKPPGPPPGTRDPEAEASRVAEMRRVKRRIRYREKQLELDAEAGRTDRTHRLLAELESLRATLSKLQAPPPPPAPEGEVVLDDGSEGKGVMLRLAVRDRSERRMYVSPEAFRLRLTERLWREIVLGEDEQERSCRA